MSEVPPPSGNWYSGQPYNQSNWDTNEVSFDNILDNGYLIVSGNTTLANLAVSGNTQLASLGVSGATNLGQLQFTGGGTTGNVNFNSKKITSLSNGTSAGDAVNRSQLDTKLSLLGGTMTGNLDFNTTNKITSLANGINSGDAINKSQLDTKLSLSGGTMSGVIDFNDNNIYNLYNIINSLPHRITIGTSPIQNVVDFRTTYTEFSRNLYINVGGGNTGIDMVNSNIINCGSINATTITGTSLTLSLPITQNAASSVYSTTLNGSTTQIGGYNFMVGTAQDLFTAGSSANVNLQTFTLYPGIWNASAIINIANNSSNTAVITRVRYGFNTGSTSITTPYTNTIIKQDIRSLSMQTTGANNQTYNFNEILINATGANITLYLNINVVWTGPTSTGFIAQSANLNLVRIA
jgi:hypothetical protein